MYMVYFSFHNFSGHPQTNDSKLLPILVHLQCIFFYHRFLGTTGSPSTDRDVHWISLHVIRYIKNYK